VENNPNILHRPLDNGIPCLGLWLLHFVR